MQAVKALVLNDQGQKEVFSQEIKNSWQKIFVCFLSMSFSSFFTGSGKNQCCTGSVRHQSGSVGRGTDGRKCDPSTATRSQPPWPLCVPRHHCNWHEADGGLASGGATQRATCDSCLSSWLPPIPRTRRLPVTSSLRARRTAISRVSKWYNSRVLSLCDHHASRWIHESHFIGEYLTVLLL